MREVEFDLNMVEIKIETCNTQRPSGMEEN
jgi:hypothetical protein